MTTGDAYQFLSGAGGDPDIHLAPGTTVAPGQQYTFSFRVVSPNAPLSSYDVKLRMVHEAVQSFGDVAEQPIALSAAPPPSPPLSRLVVRGSPSAGANGERWTMIECSNFNLYGRYLAGNDIDPSSRQRSDMGFNLLRVWLLYDVVMMDTSFPPSTPTSTRASVFLDLCGKHGLYVELTAFTCTRQLMPALSDQQAHLDRTADVVRVATNAIIEVGNNYEQSDNPWLYGQLRFLPGS